MPTSLNVNEPPNPRDRTRGLAGTGIALLSAVGLVFLVVGAVYLTSLVSPAPLQDPGWFVG
jgi:hypothetical protein